MKKRTYLPGLLTLALCASLPAVADSLGDRCGQDESLVSYTGWKACENAAVAPRAETAPVAPQGAFIEMDIIGNSGETTPEPSSLILLGGGLMGAFVTMRRGLTR